jgi:hypothetical protein
MPKPAGGADNPEASQPEAQAESVDRRNAARTNRIGQLKAYTRQVKQL